RPVERERLLLKLADLVEANLEEIAQLESLDNGKLVFFAKIVDVQGTVDYLRYMAGWATKIEGRTLDVSCGFPGDEFQAYTLRQPVGVVGQITPWNFPLAMAAWKLAPALAAGCTCVIKPAEQTSLTTLRLGELILEAGYPAGVVNIVTGFGETAGAAITAHRGIDKIAFTGSTSVGKIIGKAAMDTVKRFSLELGGKSPVIVDRDVDLEQVIPGAANGIFFNSGQVCTAGSRLYVEDSIFDKVVGGIADIAKSIKLGAGYDPASGAQLGPVVSDEQLDRVLGYIEKGKEEGGEVVAGGGRSGEQGYFVKPTVFTGLGQNSTLVREEIFGPVLVAQPYKSIDDLAAVANDTDYGLAASVWTNNLSFAHKLAKRIKAGTVWVNTHNIVDPNLPFGGMKQSGIGRENGAAAIDLYTETKTVLIKL
ncbi:MAG TPA: aldehyde dehydrogenase family protein, partial [Stellaceae bacterium]|nr:aldehyde dehydrogenase family protein [Stellaceae bacterium]